MKRSIVESIMIAVTFVGMVAHAESASDLNTAGIEYYNAKQWEEAITSFAKARSLAPDSSVVARNLCNAFQAWANELAQVADFAAAVKLLEEAISVDPKNASPLTQLGAYYLRLDMVSDAIFRLEDAIQLEPENLDGHDLLGDAYYRDNDLPSAIVQWEWVLQNQPKRKGLAEKLEKARREEGVENGFRRTESRHFNVTYSPGTAPQDLRKTLTILERAYRDIGRYFGNVYPPAPIQVIVYTADKFTEATQLGEYVGAVYDGKIRVPLRDTAGQTLPDDELERRLMHEYVHVVVRFLAGDNAPWWLNEGLAETFSNEWTERDGAALRLAVQNGGLFALHDLEEGQLEKLDKESLRRAYIQAHATVKFLWSRFGQNALAAMMSALAEGVAPETAVRQSYRRSYDLLQKEVSGIYARAE